MDSWIVSQISFWYTVHRVKPAQIVDKAIEIVLDLFTPGRGAGESSWFQRGVRHLERTVDRTQREMDLRSDLRNWDTSYPEIHHELLVRWISGAVVSMIITSVYNSIKHSTVSSSPSYGRDRRY